MVELQVLTEDDWPVWRALRQDALGEAPYAFGSALTDWQGDGDTEARWRARLSDVAHNVVALLDGSPVAMVSGHGPDEHGETELLSMWVSPAARGIGVGDALVDEVVRWSRAAGASVLALDVVVANAAAVALYRRHGFVEAGAVTEPDPAKPEVRLRLALG